MKKLTIKDKDGNFEVPIIDTSKLSYTVIIQGRYFFIPKTKHL